MKVFYRKEMSAATESFSPSSSKPSLVVADWQNDPLISCEICTFPPATRAQISLAHDEDFVDGVLECRFENGFGNTDEALADSLPYTSGSMIAAAHYAVLNNEITCAPVSGAHHAFHDQCGSFCSFNFLLVAALVLKKKGLVNRVKILDLDRHFSDGSVQIIRHLGLESWITNHSQGQFINSRNDVVNGKYTKWLDNAIEDCLGGDLVVVQLGVDGHLLDPLGGIMSTVELAQRDRLVFEKLGHLPLCWALAGGYQVAQGNTPAARLEPVLALHRQSARIACEVISRNKSQSDTLVEV
jgi:acetoin utilization deacetylase AcuC-like enzyme